MVDGVQSRSLAQAAAATLKLLRSAHKRTLPAKNTTTVTGQLIGRTSARSGLAEAISVLAGMTFSRQFCLRHSRVASVFRTYGIMRLPLPAELARKDVPLRDG